MRADFSRWARGLGRVAQRRFGGGPKTWLRGFFASAMMRWDRPTVARGVAIGMFWAWPPIPFQMAPTALLCWLAGGNLPLAIACVWISNPLTYLPIFALEYRIGLALLGLPRPATSLLERLRGGDSLWMEIVNNLWEIGVPVLLGALFLSVSTAIVGYAVMGFLWKERPKAAHRRAADRARPD